MTAPPRAREHNHARRRRITRRQVVCPRPRDYQQAPLEADAKRKVLAAGRRWGKSTLALVAAIAGHGPIDATGLPKFRGAAHGSHVWWVVPDMPTTGRDRWRDLKKALRGAWTLKNEVEHRIELPGGGSITIRSADDPDSLRGPSLDGVVLDEAALMDPDTWTEALRPALSDFDGWAIFISTPKGRANWFWELFTRGAGLELLEQNEWNLERDGNPARAGWASWQRPSSDNHQLPATELEDALHDLGAHKFAQEYLALFIVPAGKVFHRSWFRRYQAAGEQLLHVDADAPYQVAAARLRLVACMDMAFSLKAAADYTALVVVGITPHGHLLVLDVVRDRIEAPELVPEVQASRRRWRWPYVGAEANGPQLAMVQLLKRAGIPVRKVKVVGDKLNRATVLAVKLEAGEVFLPTQAAWLDELEAELLEFDGTGKGHHDDQVDALAYAVAEALNGPGRQLTSS